MDEFEESILKTEKIKYACWQNLSPQKVYLGRVQIDQSYHSY